MNIPFPPVDFPEPVIHPAQRNFQIVLEDGSPPAVGYLRRANDDHEFAYEKCPKLPVKLPNGKGSILYARVYKREVDSVGYLPTEEFVVIKKLSKAFLQRQQPGNEDPYREISVAQMIGDNIHVVAMQEVLEDEKYLFMVMPYFGSDLLEAVLSTDQQPNVPRLLRTLVRNLLYLEFHKVLHRDLSPENIIVHNEFGENCCPMIDFAMSLQCATLEGNTLPIQAQEQPCGKLPYIAPEVVYVEPLSFGIDVWATGVTLFVIWTRQRLYDQPHDRCWNYFLRDGGLEQDQVHLLNPDNWNNAADVPPEFNDLVQRIQAVQTLSSNQRKLLADMLRIRPEDRIRSQDIMDHPWIQEPEQQILLQEDI